MIFKVVIDLEQTNLNKLFNKFNQNKIECCIANESLFLYSENNKQSSIDNIMKEANIENYFIKEIKEKPNINDGGFSEIWCRERMERDEELRIAAENQNQLKQMIKNIEDIKKTLIINKEGRASDGTRGEQGTN